MERDNVLEVDGLSFAYEKAAVLHDVNLEVRRGEIVALVGRNGAGKSTTMKVIAGLLGPNAGHIRLSGAEIEGKEPHLIARAGIGYVPEDRQIFPNLTTLENLRVAQLSAREGAFGLDEVLAIFPRLAEKSATFGENLSGGERQMLAVSRALLTNPTVLLLDEPTEGLAPVVVDAMIAALGRIHEAGVSLLLVEQNFKFTTELATRQYVIDGGRIVWSGTTSEFEANRKEIESLLL